MKIFETFLYSNIDLTYLEKWDKQLKEYCEIASQFDKGVTVSNAGGWQSQEFNWNNLKYFDMKMFENIQSSITKCLQQAKMCDNVQATFKNFWINVNPPGSYNHTHIHPGSQLSGVFYVKVPSNSGGIVFSNNLEELNPLSKFTYDQGPDHMTINPKEGQTLIFNSYLPHSVDVNKSNDTRISIAFNILLSK